MAQFARALLAIALCCTAVWSQVPARLDLELSIAAAESVLEGHGPSASASYVVIADGSLFVWADSEDFDPFLRIESSDGSVRLENDNDGGATTAWVRTAVKAGAELKIHVAAQSDSAAGIARLHIRELPETEAAQEAKLNLDAALEEAQRLAREQDVPGARELLEIEALALLASAGVEHHAGAHVVLWRAGNVLDTWGGSQTSLVIFEALARFGEPLYPPYSRARLQVLASTCGMLGQLGRSEEAMPYCEQALRISEHSFGARSVETATVRANLGLVQIAAHQLEAARDSMQSAVDDFARTLGSEHVNTAQAQSTLGSVLKDLGELDEARRVQERSIEVMRKGLDETDYRLLAAQTNLAATLSALGDDRAARTTHEAILAVYLRLHAPDSLDVLRARHNVAICRMRAKELNEACAEFEALSAIYRRLGLTASTEAELTEVARGSTYNKLGRFQDALRMVEDRRRLPGRQVPAGDWRLNGLEAQALIGTGDLQRALQQAEASLSAIARALPPENPDLAEQRQVAASLNLKLGKPERAFELTRQAVFDAQGYLARCATTLSMSQAEAAQAHWSRLVSSGIALLEATAPAGQRAQADALAFELSESARGIGTALLRCSQASSSPGVEALRRQVRECAREVASIGVGGQATALEAAIAAKERSERELRDALTLLIGHDLATARPSAKSIQASLAPNEALVAYWRIDTRPIDAPESTPLEARLCAFVMSAEHPVRRFDLGPLAPISAAVQAWRATIAESGAGAAAREIQAGSNLRSLVIDPLLEAIGPAVHWRVALDDVLHLVALDALPHQGRRLGDSVQLVASPTCLKLPAGGHNADSFLLLGGVDYDFQDDAQASRSTSPIESSPRATSAALRPHDFHALWETQDEVDALVALYTQTRAASPTEEVGAPPVKLCDREATKPALVSSAARASFIHIATHGYFVADPSNAAKAAQLALAERSPLSLCGLALTGANTEESPSDSEGVITAEELATLDLSGCRLVVLSACDTNVGTLSAGQGVASFQKALHAAGALQVVTALWKVDDRTTRELMLEFYQGMWVDQLTPEQALWRAKSRRIARRAPVRDWAGWVLSSQ